MLTSSSFGDLDRFGLTLVPTVKRCGFADDFVLSSTDKAGGGESSFEALLLLLLLLLLLFSLRLSERGLGLLLLR